VDAQTISIPASSRRPGENTPANENFRANSRRRGANVLVKAHPPIRIVFWMSLWISRSCDRINPTWLLFETYIALHPHFLI